MIFTTPDGQTVEWADGRVTSNPPELAMTIMRRVATGEPVGWNYWSEEPPSLRTQWGAYLTIGAVLRDELVLDNDDLTVDDIPEPADGYEPEGPRFEDDPLDVTA